MVRVMIGVGVRVRPKKMNWPVADGSDVVFAVTQLLYKENCENFLINIESTGRSAREGTSAL